MAGSPTSTSLAVAAAVAAAGLSLAPAPAAGRRPPAPRFHGRVQVLSGAGFTLLRDAADRQIFSAYVPLDLELGLRASGPVSVVIGGAGFAAPVRAPACEGAEGRRPHALASYAWLRLDLNNSRDGSWLSPWLALRAGLVGQDGVPGLGPGPTPGSVSCTERVTLGPFFSPRAWLDLWLGAVAVTFAVGYDALPRASAVAAQLGLTLRLF